MKQYAHILRAITPTLYPAFGKAAQSFYVDEATPRDLARRDIISYLVDNHSAYDIHLFYADPFSNFVPAGKVKVVATFWHPGMRPRLVDG